MDIINCGNSLTEGSDGPGIYNYKDGRIMLCHDYWKDKTQNLGEMKNFISRHLVSAFDHCNTDIETLSREEFLDFKTCSAIRSFTLTGECLYERQSYSNR